MLQFYNVNCQTFALLYKRGELYRNNDYQFVRLIGLMVDENGESSLMSGSIHFDMWEKTNSFGKLVDFLVSLKLLWSFCEAFMML